MRSLFFLLSVLLLLPVTGCRDAVVDPLPDDASPGVTSSEEFGDFYVKGPDTMVLGQESEFRTEANGDGSASFAWFFQGERILDVDSPRSRITRITARDYGSVGLVAVHYDRSGREIGRGLHQVTVVLD